MEREEIKEQAAQKNSGVATDIALNDEVNKQLVEDEICQLNNNPRNND